MARKDRERGIKMWKSGKKKYEKDFSKQSN